MKKNNRNESFPFFSLLGLLFIALKLCHVITWSWWIVLLPFYGGLIICIILYLIFMIL